MLIISNDRFSRLITGHDLSWARAVCKHGEGRAARPKTKSATATGCDEEGRVRCAVVIDSIRSLGLGSALVDCGLLALNLPCGGSTGVFAECGGGREV